MTLKKFMDSLTGKSAETTSEFSGYVHDIDTAKCVFCPYGADLKSGDRVEIHDEKTVFGRVQRRRLVEIIEVKVFRTNGRLITLGTNTASPEDVWQIANDSDVTVDQLLTHRMGKATYDTGKPPVVVYFQPIEEA
jgi:hypothetical protein